MKAEPGSLHEGQVAACYVLRNDRFSQEEKQAVGMGIIAIMLLGTDLRCYGEENLVCGFAAGTTIDSV